MYSSQWPRSARSDGENFQFFSGRFSRSRNRFFCSSLDTCRKNLRITVPLRTRCRSNDLMSSYRSSQNFLPTFSFSRGSCRPSSSGWTFTTSTSS